MSKKTKKCKCGKPSLKGLSGPNPPCQFHWNEGNWGTEWAEHCRAKEMAEGLKERVHPFSDEAFES